MNTETIYPYTTKSNTIVTMNGEHVRFTPPGGKSTAIHIGHFCRLENSEYKSELTAKLKKSGRDIADIGCVALDTLTVSAAEPVLVAELLKKATEYRVASVAKAAEAEADRATLVAEITAACPAGYEVATVQSRFDGIAQFEAADGTTVSSWDDAYKNEGAGMYYVETEKFEAARITNKAKAEREAAATATAKANCEAKAAEASTTGKPVILVQWTTDRCHNGNSCECSCDNATKYIHPDGQTTTKYTCCF